MPEENNQENSAEKEDDFVIRNMPAAERLSGRFLNPNVLKSGGGSEINAGDQSGASSGHNFKAVGLIIIIGGLIFISGLVYLTYRFVISPAAEPAQQEVLVPEIKEEKDETSVVSPAVVTPIPSAADLEDLSPVTVESVGDDGISAETENIVMSEEAPVKTAADFPPLLDSDEDGLNDEEESVFGTSATLSDSDSDGYDDLAEIKNNYNPAGDGQLEYSPSLEVYVNNELSYHLLYPKDWPVVDSGAGLAIFTAPDDSLIQISVQDNASGTNILNWYEGYFSNETVSYDRLKSAATWDGVIGPDGLNFYLTDKKQKNIFIISYISSVSDRIAYPNVFEMMLNSLVVE